MAAPKGNKNGLGNSGGKTKNDRELAARVRSLTLREIEKALKARDDEDFRKQLILKLAGTVLPRLNEVSGPDGEQLEVGVVMLPPKNASPLETPTETGGRAK